MSDFLSLAADTPASAELEIQRSRFLAYAQRADNENSARKIIEKQKKLYPDAHHHCTAFTFKPENSNPITRSSDDGEPSGTAGRPMLDTLLGSNLQNVTVVVTRYFGGTKLGTGGLVRAYSKATQKVINNAKQVKICTLPVVSFDVSLTQAPALEGWLRSQNLAPSKINWSAHTANFQLAIHKLELGTLTTQLSNQLGKTVSLHPAGTQTIETPI